MAENRDLKDNIMLEEGLSTKGDSEKSPEMKELKILKEKEAERLQVTQEVIWTLKSAKVEVRLVEVVEWLVADPQVIYR